MTEIQVTFQQQDETNEQTIGVSPTQRIGDFREVAQMLLGLPENPPCQIVLKRTGETLRDSLTFEDTDIKHSDKLVLVTPSIFPDTKSKTSSKKSSFSSSSNQFSIVQEEISEGEETSSLVTYTLQLTVVNNADKPSNYNYSIDLEEDYEDNPERFFTDFNKRERRNFATALRSIIPREVQSSEVDTILLKWCKEITLGYRFTPIEIEIEKK